MARIDPQQTQRLAESEWRQLLNHQLWVPEAQVGNG